MLKYFLLRHRWWCVAPTLSHDQFVPVFTRWLICMNSYDLTHTFFTIFVMGRFRGGPSYEFLWIGHFVKYVRLFKNCKRVRSYKFLQISHLVKYVRIAMSLGWLLLKYKDLLCLLICLFYLFILLIVSLINLFIIYIFLPMAETEF